MTGGQRGKGGGIRKRDIMFSPLPELTAWTVVSEEQTLFSGRRTGQSFKGCHEYLWLFSGFRLSLGGYTRFPLTACGCLLLVRGSRSSVRWGRQSHQVALLCLVNVGDGRSTAP